MKNYALLVLALVTVFQVAAVQTETYVKPLVCNFELTFENQEKRDDIVVTCHLFSIFEENNTVQLFVNPVRAPGVLAFDSVWLGVPKEHNLKLKQLRVSRSGTLLVGEPIVFVLPSDDENIQYITRMQANAASGMWKKGDTQPALTLRFKTVLIK
jgi:hypothetical protein